MSTTIGGLLLRARQAQSMGDPNGVYNEVLRAVSKRAAADGCLSKADIGALVLWKRITAQTRWAAQLMLTPDSEVRAATGIAYTYANDSTLALPAAGLAAREALRTLPGMGGTAALASAVLLALAPKRMAVWDSRVGTALTALDLHPATGRGFYSRYIATTLDLAEQMTDAGHEGVAVPRDVDLALFHLAGSPEMLHAARQCSPPIAVGDSPSAN